MCLIYELSFLPRSEVEELTSRIYLSDDEESVLALALRRKTAQQISMELNMSERTVYRVKRNIIQKMSNLVLR